MQQSNHETRGTEKTGQGPRTQGLLRRDREKGAVDAAAEGHQRGFVSGEDLLQAA